MEEQRTIDIPPVFQSFVTGKPFDKCLVCERNLLEEGVEYMIEKAMRVYKPYGVKDVIFEYAICMDCADEVRQKMSVESMLAISTYLHSKVNFSMRGAKLFYEHGTDLEPWISNCAVTNTPIEEMEEYQMYAHCVGYKLVFDMFPYAIGFEAMDEIAALLSNKTLDELDNFKDEFLGPPPEFEDELSKKRVILV